MANVLYSSNLILSSSWWTGSSQFLVKSIVDEYNDLVVEEVSKGSSVNYLDLAIITVGGSKNSTPLGYYYYEVAERLNLEYIVVENILSRYAELIKNNLLLKNVVVVYGILKFSPRDSYRVNVKSSSRISSLGSNVRAKLNPYWKYEMGKIAL